MGGFCIARFGWESVAFGRLHLGGYIVDGAEIQVDLPSGATVFRKGRRFVDNC